MMAFGCATEERVHREAYETWTVVPASVDVVKGVAKAVLEEQGLTEVKVLSEKPGQADVSGMFKGAKIEVVLRPEEGKGTRVTIYNGAWGGFMPITSDGKLMEMDNQTLKGEIVTKIKAKVMGMKK